MTDACNWAKMPSICHTVSTTEYNETNINTHAKYMYVPLAKYMYVTLGI